jgi:hypothetical protein
MNIAILGAGNVGAALGRGWTRRGHRVIYGVRDPGSARARAAAEGGSEVTTPRAAAEAAEVVVLATPWGAARDAVESLGDLGGRVLVDATNPIGPGLSPAVGPDTSGAEEIQAVARGARVVKAFNTTGAENMVEPAFGDRRAAMFLCGDDAAACDAVAGLAADLGFEPVRAGPLRNARLLEPLARLWITLATPLGMGRGIAFALLRREAGAAG